jgi:hypothetical protein
VDWVENTGRPDDETESPPQPKCLTTLRSPPPLEARMDYVDDGGSSAACIGCPPFPKRRGPKALPRRSNLHDLNDATHADLLNAHSNRTTQRA